MSTTSIRRLGISGACMAIALAGAQAETIDFSQFADGTDINGLVVSPAIFTTSTPMTVESEGVPLDGPYGTAPFVVGPAEAFLQVNFQVPMRSVEFKFVLNDTIMSSAGAEVMALGVHGFTVDFQTPTLDIESQGIWPAINGDSGAGTANVQVGGLDFGFLSPIEFVQIRFINLVFADTVALDDFSYLCASDVNEDGETNIADLNMVLSHFGEQGEAGTNGDANFTGLVDIEDLNLVLTGFDLPC